MVFMCSECIYLKGLEGNHVLKVKTKHQGLTGSQSGPVSQKKAPEITGGE